MNKILLTLLLLCSAAANAATVKSADFEAIRSQLNTYTPPAYTWRHNDFTVQQTAKKVKWRAGYVQWEQTPTWVERYCPPALAAVPLPAAGWLFGAAMFGLVGVARKRRPKNVWAAIKKG